jgi:hypothetical protein
MPSFDAVGAILPQDKILPWRVSLRKKQKRYSLLSTSSLIGKFSSVSFWLEPIFDINIKMPTTANTITTSITIRIIAATPKQKTSDTTGFVLCLISAPVNLFRQH